MYLYHMVPGLDTPYITRFFPSTYFTSTLSPSTAAVLSGSLALTSSGFLGVAVTVSFVTLPTLTLRLVLSHTHTACGDLTATLRYQLTHFSVRGDVNRLPRSRSSTSGVGGSHYVIHAAFTLPRRTVVKLTYFRPVRKDRSSSSGTL